MLWYPVTTLRGVLSVQSFILRRKRTLEHEAQVFGDEMRSTCCKTECIKCHRAGTRDDISVGELPAFTQDFARSARTGDADVILQSKLWTDHMSSE